MQAELIYWDKKKLASGAIMEMVIWKLPEASAERPMATNTGFIMESEASALWDTTTSAAREITATIAIVKNLTNSSR